MKNPAPRPRSFPHGLCLAVLFLPGLTQLMASSHLIYLGTYTRGGASKGIYSARLDARTGAVTTPIVAAEATDPAWIALSPDKKHLYAIHASVGQAAGFAVDAAQGSLTPLPAGEAASPAANPPSHLAIDATGRTLLAANYRDGYVAAVPIRSDGTLGAPNIIRHEGKGTHPTRQEKAHAHSVTLSPDNRFVIVADLGVDKVFSYALDPAAAKLTPGPVPFVAAEAGAGPRHFKFGRDGTHAYVINELANTIVAYAYDAKRGALTPRQTIATLPEGFNGRSTTAEVRVHPNGRFLYGSNRGDDSLAVFAIGNDGLLTPVEVVPSGGKTPRNFALSPDGNWLVCGHQDSEYITVFRVDAHTGRLTRTEHAARVPMCVCILFYD